MKLNKIALPLLLVLSGSAMSGQNRQAGTLAALRAGFDHPPGEDKPMVRWWWFGTAVQKPELLKELRQMKADGIGGVELAFVYPEVVDDPAKGLINLPFLSPGMLEAVSYAQNQARKLGLRVDLTLCSGWPYGGPATTLEHAASRLRTVEENVPAGASTVSLPALESGERILSASLFSGGVLQPFTPGVVFRSCRLGA